MSYLDLKSRMLAVLRKWARGITETSGPEFDFDAESAIWWFANDYHSGGGSELYQILSRSELKPGPSHRSVADEGEVPAMMYEVLEQQFIPKGRASRNPRRSSVRKNIFVFNNSPSGPADADAARELELYIDNDADLYRQQYQPIIKNLMLKRRKGIYDREKAVKLFMYLMDSGAKKYVREFVQSSTPGSIAPKIDTVFNKNTRLMAARAFRDSFETEAELGNYDRLIGPVSNPRGVRKNIFTFNNPRDSAVEAAAREVGLFVGVWSPGDGTTRYRFFTKTSPGSSYADYHQGDGIYTALGRKDALSFIVAYRMGRKTRRNPPSKSVRAFRVPSGLETQVASMLRDAFIWAQARDGDVLTLARPDIVERAIKYVKQHGYKRNPSRDARSFISSEIGHLRRKGYPEKRAAAAAYSMARRAGYKVNGAVCSNPVIRGDKLPHHLQQEVLRTYIYRWTTGNTQRDSAWAGISGKPRIPLISDAQWLREHAFHVTKAGRLNLNHHHAEPYYMADDWKKGGPLPNPLLQTIMMANPGRRNAPLSSVWSRLTTAQRQEVLEISGIHRDNAELMAFSSWSALRPAVKGTLERGWYDTGSRSTGGTTRRRVAVPVGANPLTRRETAKVLRTARAELAGAHGTKEWRAYKKGRAYGYADVAADFGPRKARQHSAIQRAKAAVFLKNNPPSSLRLPAPGTKMTVAQAMDLARRIGNRDLIKQCQEAMRLQKTSDRNTKCVIWKHLPLGSKTQIDAVVAMTHYGTSPEDMYKPPTGSKKGPHMYRHKWKKSVPVLASPSGKAIIKVMGPGQKVGDWMRG